MPVTYTHREVSQHALWSGEPKWQSDELGGKKFCPMETVVIDMLPKFNVLVSLYDSLPCLLLNHE